MSRLTLTRIRRNQFPTDTFLDGQITVKFGEQAVWGPFPVQAGQDIDLINIPAGVPAPTPSGIFFAPDFLQISLLFSDGQVDFPIARDVLPISSLPLGPGSPSRDITYPDGGTVFTLDYEVLGGFGTAVFALIGGVGIAIITFITTVVLLVVNFFRSLPYVVSRPFRRSSISNVDKK